MTIKEILSKIVDFPADLLHVADDVVKVFRTAKSLSPAFEAEFQTIMADLTPLSTALAPVLSDPENVLSDAQAAEILYTDGRKLVSDFIRFLPTLKEALKQLESDTQ